MQLHLIYARAANGVIGCNNALPWHLPEDMAHFKRITQGHPVIMGRKTWDSIPKQFRPLPKRLNVVVTRQPNWQAPGALCANSLVHAMELCATHASAPTRAWVIGGAQIYAQALSMAHGAVVTEIDAKFAGDALAPTLGTDWTEIARESHVAANGLRYSFVTFSHNIAEV